MSTMNIINRFVASEKVYSSGTYGWNTLFQDISDILNPSVGVGLEAANIANDGLTGTELVHHTLVAANFTAATLTGAKFIDQDIDANKIYANAFHPLTNDKFNLTLGVSDGPLAVIRPAAYPSPFAPTTTSDIVALFNSGWTQVLGSSHTFNFVFSTAVLNGPMGVFADSTNLTCICGVSTDRIVGTPAWPVFGNPQIISLTTAGMSIKVPFWAAGGGPFYMSLAVMVIGRETI